MNSLHEFTTSPDQMLYDLSDVLEADVVVEVKLILDQLSNFILSSMRYKKGRKDE